MNEPLISDDDVASRDEFGDWTIADGTMSREVSTPDFASALELVNRIGAVAESMNHHPDITLGYGRVGISVTTHDSAGLTRLDLDLARAVNSLIAADDR